MSDMNAPPRPFTLAHDDDAAPGLRGAVVTIGNFDGVHLGHRAAIAAARMRGDATGRPAAALTFEPHPRSFFRPNELLFRLSDAATKVRLLAATGLDGVIVLGFNEKLASLSATDFVREILVERFAITGAMIGHDFNFGNKRTGTPAFLAERGEKHGFSVEVVPHFAIDGRPVSSGAIRNALAAGKIDDATAMLGYPWFVTGEVVHGEKRGRDLGFPTANIRVDPACRLRHGIYAVRVRLDGRLYDGVASFGRRPTFDNGPVLLETMLFDFEGDLYGKTLDIAFIAWIREELKFDSIDALIVQMKQDSQLSRDALNQHPGTFPLLA